MRRLRRLHLWAAILLLAASLSVLALACSEQGSGRIARTSNTR